MTLLMGELYTLIKYAILIRRLLSKRWQQAYAEIEGVGTTGIARNCGPT
jgi:hypothetical protein